MNLKKCHIKLGRYYVEHQLTETKFRVNKEVKFRFRFRCLLQLANKFISTYPGRQRLPGINSITEILQDSHQDDTRSETAGFRLKGRKISGYMLTEKTSTYDSACVQIKNSITDPTVCHMRLGDCLYFSVAGPIQRIVLLTISGAVHIAAQRPILLSILSTL